VATQGITPRRRASAPSRRPVRWTAAIALITFLVLASSMLPAGPGAFGAESDAQYLVQMRHQSFTPPAGATAAALEYMERNAGLGQVHLLVQMTEIPASSERTSLAGRGLVLQGYVPERAYYALVSTGLTAADLAGLGVRWAAPLGIEEKVSARVLSGEEAPWAEHTEGRQIFSVQFHDDVARDVAERMLTELATSAGGPNAEFGGWISSIRTQIVALPPRLIDELARQDQVKHVTFLPPVLSEVNDQIRSSIGVNTILEAPYGLDGSGSNVLVYDAGHVDRNHPDLAGRVTYGEAGGAAQHSTHVGGTVGGNGTNSGGTYKGMAPATAITSYFLASCNPNCLYNSPSDIESNYHDALHDHGADFATNSLASNVAINGYPCSWEGDYELTAQLIDAIAGGSLGVPFMSLWAAGNERAYGTCGTGYNTTGIPATAKNNIVVGATNSNDHSMTYFSSWGPVDDGRTRPDVCAPGCQVGGDGGITSTTPGGGYGSMCGTSMATPATAGVVADLLQEWRGTMGLPLRPLPATIKALLINTANDYGTAGPDYQFGYGEIRPVELIDHLRNRYLLRQGMIEHAEEVIFPVTVPAGTSVLKATLAWDDVPGQQLAQRELVNDLDLTLESPSGEFTMPWILTPANPSAPATRGTDRINPSEQALVSNPAAGTWKVHVKGYAVPQGPQSFGVVANAVRGQDQSGAPDEAVLPGGLDVESYPNPFSPRTTIAFRTDRSGAVSIHVFDSAGRKVRTLLDGEVREAGTQEVAWDGRDDAGAQVAGGVYFYQVVSGDRTEGRKLLLVK